MAKIEKFLKISGCILAVLLIIYLCLQISQFLNIIYAFFMSVVIPILISLVLYYILRPLRDFLISKKIPKPLAILVIALLIIVFFVLAATFLWPVISAQIIEFSATLGEKIKTVENKTEDIASYFNFSIYEEQFKQMTIMYSQKFAAWIVTNMTSTLTSLAQITSYFIITPFIVFYLLKDDHDMSRAVQNAIPKTYAANGKKLLHDIDNVLSGYISSQLTVSLIVSVLIFLGYVAIGLNYALLLAIIAFVFNLIPFCGPIISTIPALFIGFSVSSTMCLKVLLVVLLVHLLDLNIISPRIVGPRLQIHPVTILLLLIASLSTLGFLGLFIIVPLYAVLKVIVQDYIEMDFYPFNSSEKQKD